MSDPLDFLDEPKGSNAEPIPTPEPAVVETPPPPQVATPDPQAAPQAPAAAPEPASIPPGHVPLAVMLDDREKRQAAERERDEYKRKIDELSKKPSEPLDPLTDPEGYTKHFESQVAKAKEDVRFEVTHMFAVNKHGADVVKAAEAWLEEELKNGRIAFQQVSSQPDPYDFMVQQHKRHVGLQKIGSDDPETWAEKWAKEKGWQPPQLVPETPGQVRAPNGQFVAAPPPQPTPLPKPSLASAPAASGNTPKIPTGPGAAFDEVFN